MKVCIVTSEDTGSDRSGGIASRGVLDLLVAAGDEVDLLLTGPAASGGDEPDLPPGVRTMTLAAFVAGDRRCFPPGDATSTAHAVYRFVAGRGYDVVHCPDARGLGFYVAMAIRQGLLDARLVTHLDGLAYQRRLFELTPPTLEDLEREAIEKSQIELSDWVVSRSAFLIDAYRGLGVVLPRSRVIDLAALQAPRGVASGPATSSEGHRPAAIGTFVFIGAQQRGDGFDAFVDALSLLPRELHREVVFLGPLGTIDGECSASMALRRLASYAGRLRFIDDVDRPDALRTLAREQSAICVVPSRVGDDRTAVLDCLQAGISFLASTSGEGAELVAAESRASCLVVPEPKSLAQALARVVRDGVKPIVVTRDDRGAASDWQDFRAALCAEAPSAGIVVAPKADAPLVSVCLVHYQRPALARQALDALMSQTYDRIEIVLVDDGSTSENAIAFLDEIERRRWRFPLKVVRSENRYLGAARNLGARHASGEFIVFHDDDNIAEAHEIATFVKAMTRSGCDILTSVFWMFRPGDERDLKSRRRIEYYPLGIGGPFSYFANRFGDANAMFRRRVFEQLEGFTELFGVGLEDWELFLRAWLRGYKLGVVPEPLFNYRISPSSMLLSGNDFLNDERLYRAVDRESGRLSADLLRLAKGPQQLRESRARLEALLEREPGAQAHLALLDAPTDGPGVKPLLSDIAFELGRHADAWALGLSNPAQRAKLLAHGVVDGAAAQNPLFATVTEKPKVGSGASALCLVGWGVAERGAVVPRLLAIDGAVYELIAHAALERTDVARHLDLRTDLRLGFALLVRRCSGASPLRRKGFLRQKGVAIGASLHKDVRILAPTPRGLKGFIDEILPYQVFEVRSPANGASGRLSVRTDRSSVVFVTTGRDGYRAMSAAPRTLARVKTAPGAAISLAIPDDGETEITLQ